MPNAPRIDDYVSYHGSLTEYVGMVFVLADITESTSDFRMVGSNDRYVLQGFGTNANIRLSDVRPTSFSLVKAV